MSSFIGLADEDSTLSLGASGAISAVISFVCLVHRGSKVDIDIFSWLKAFIAKENIRTSLAIAGMIWFCSDCVGLLKLNHIFEGNNESTEDEKNIAFSSHVGGSIFGFLFALIYMHRALFWGFISIPLQATTIIVSGLISIYLFLLPDHVLQSELDRRRIARNRK
jgi:membrane associated rhomboid family serine protease